MALVGKLLSVSVASNKGEAEPERKETRNKVDEDRKHEYPFLQRLHGLWKFGETLMTCCFTFTETIGLLGTGAQDGHLNFHIAPELSLGKMG